MAADARWWTVAAGAEPQARDLPLPFCGRHLPALSEHVLIMPEGDATRRRHAHTACALAERRAGRLPDRDEYRATQPREPGLLVASCGAARPGLA